MNQASLFNFISTLLFCCFSLFTPLNAQFFLTELVDSGFEYGSEIIEDLNGDGIVDIYGTIDYPCEGDKKKFIAYGLYNEIIEKYDFKIVWESEEKIRDLFKVMDINNDGKKDIIAYFSSNNPMHFIVSENESYIVHEKEYFPIKHETDIYDVDNDGKEELIFSDDDQIFWLTFDQDLNPIFSSKYLNEKVYDINITDYNFDGFEDAVFRSGDSLYLVAFSGGTYTLDFTIFIENVNLNGVDDLIFEDVDQDGKMDMAFQIDSFYVVNDFINQGFSSIEVICRGNPSNDRDLIHHLDMDDDGIEDLLINDELNIENSLVVAKSGKRIYIPNQLKQDRFQHLRSTSFGSKVVGLINDNNFYYYSTIIVDMYLSNDTIAFDIQNLFPLYNAEVYNARKADLNNDQIDDFVYSFKIGHTSLGLDGGKGLSALLSNLDGSYNKPRMISGHYEFLAGTILCLGDINDDGHVDIVTSNFEVFFNDGQGNFSFPEKIYNFETPPIAIETDDFNMDGLVDLAALFFNDDVVFLENKGAGSFESHTIETNPYLIGIGGFITTHLNDDDYPDLLVWESVIGEGRKYINNGDDTYEVYETTVETQSFFNTDAIVTDFLGDKRIEKVRSLSVHPNRFYLNIKQISSNDESDVVLLNIEFQDIPIPEELRIYDLDNDGDKDILYSSGDTYEDKHWIRNEGSLDLVYAGQLLDFVDASNIPVLFEIPIITTNYEHINDIVYGNCGDTWLIKRDGKQINLCAYYDVNGNEIIDTSDNPLVNQKLSVESANSKSILALNNIGCASFNIRNGEYNILIDGESCIKPHFSYSTILVDELSSDHELLFTISGEEKDLVLDLTSGPTRCGFVVPHFLSINNRGCSTLDGKVIVELDQKIDVSNLVSEFPFEIESNLIKFPIEDWFPGEIRKIKFHLQLPDFNFTGQLVSHTTSFVDGFNEILASAEYSETLRCAIDPNDKSLIPDRTLQYQETYITDEKIEYLIRFQNVGNDTAINIRVEDTISTLLNLESIANITSSHQFQLNLDSFSRRMNFLFPNVYLVDSLTDEPNSHGFIKFEIEPIPGLDEFQSIYNAASIYFDFNPPIHTNITEAIYVSDFSLIINSLDNEPEKGLMAYPNPTQGLTSIINVETYYLSTGQISIDVVNSMGQVVLRIPFFKGSQLDMTSLPNGIYFLYIKSKDKIQLIKVSKI